MGGKRGFRQGPVDLTPGGPKCANNIVVLYRLSSATPPNYDFPATRKALRGHREFDAMAFAVTEDHGRKYFTAATPDFNLAVRLSRIIAKSVKDATPSIICAEPKLVRRVDLAAK